MYIDEYNFGQITIDGKEYLSDLLIYPDGKIKEGWRRVDGHELAPEDLEDIPVIKPDVFIMGTGYSGILEVLPETEKFLEENGIELHEAKTGEAVKLFNELYRKKGKKVMAGFHLTC